jgi:hypothetical protein
LGEPNIAHFFLIIKLNNMNIIQWIINLFSKSHIIVPPGISGTINYAPTITYPAANWINYCSQPFRTQWVSEKNGFDEDNCATRSAVEVLEALLNYYLRNHLFPAPIEAYFRNPVNMWLNSNGDVKISIRYNARENNTTKNGCSVNTVWNNFAQYGIVPEALYPDPPSPFTWNDYYANVPDDICMFGEYVATSLFQVIFGVVTNNNWNVPNIPQLQQWLQHSPLYFASGIGKQDANGVEQWNGVKQYQHARVLCQEDGYAETLDSYPPNYYHKLSQSFPLACVISVSLKII